MAEAFGIAASALAVAELSAKVISQCLQYSRAVRYAKDDVERVTEQVANWNTVAKKLQNLLDGPHRTRLEASQELRGALNGVRFQLESLHDKLTPDKTRRAMSKIGIRALKWPFDSKEVEKILQDLARCVQPVTTALQIDQTVAIFAIDNNLTSVDQRTVLRRLPEAAGAAFDSHAEEHKPTCLPDTRVDLLREISQWVEDPAAKAVFWLNGMAGTGKSTISRTLARSFFDRGQLGASFFFKRGEDDRSGVSKFFTTIAAQLTRREPTLAVYVKEAIDTDPAIFNKAMREQLEKLILEPLSHVRNTNTLVIVVDALDECDRDEDVKLLIHLLSRVNAYKSLRLRIFLTSRPELPIRLGFHDVKGTYQDLILHEVEQPIIEHDLSVYFKHELAKVRREYNDSIPQQQQLPSTWPEESQVQTLVQLAIPLFIFAATACRFVANRRTGTPESNLRKILLNHRVVGASDSSFRGFQGREKLDHTFDFQNIDDFELETVPQQVAASTMSPVDKGALSTSQTNETRSTTMEKIFDAETLSHSTRFTASLHTLSGLAEMSLEKLPPMAEQDENYSDAGSIADYEEAYVNIIRNELLQDLESVGLMNVEAKLSPLLEEFAIRIGYQGETKEHQNMMYATHKYRRRIASEACRVQMELQRDHDMDESAGSERMTIDHDEYYSNEKIEDWQHETEDYDDSGSLVDDDPMETRLGLGRNALRESEAYKWLVSSIKRELAMNGVSPTSMKNHREWMLNILETNTPREQMTELRKISRSRRPATYTARFELSWNLNDFLKSQKYESEHLHEIVGKVITVSGDQHCAQALPCKEYMEQIWPCTGAAVEELLEIIVKAPGQCRECVLPDSTHIWAQLLEDCVLLEATGSKYGLAEMTEQLFWVSTALQTPTFDPGLSLNSAKTVANFTPDTSFYPNLQHHIPRSVHVGTAHCKVQFENVVPDKSSQTSEGDCWHNLFRHCTVVFGYPIPSRPSCRPGLEIQLGMMAELSCAERITAFGSSIILKGYSTLIFLVHHEDGCIFWHMVYNEDGSQISFADDRIFDTGASGLALLGNVDDTRHFLGWAPKVKKTTGAIDAKYDIGWSALYAPPRGYALEKVQISAGKYVTASGTFAVGKRDKAVHIKDRDDYLVRLQSLGEKFVVLLDVETHKAWLVDGLSALLHLTRANLVHEHKNSDYKLASLCSPDALEARSGYSGRKVAFDTLCDAANQRLHLHRKDGTSHKRVDMEVNDNNFYCLVDAVKYIMHLLEQIIAHQADERTESSVGYRIKLSPWSQLEGFDFMDIATKTDPIWPRATMLRYDGKAWVGLTRAIHATALFGKGFGELVEPTPLAEGQQPCDACYWNTNMPADRDLLAVPMSELERIVERRGQKLGAWWRLVDDLHLQLIPALFSDCSGGDGRVCCHQPRLQRIRQGTPYAGHMSQEKDRSRLHKLLSRPFHRHDDRTLLAEKDIASVHFPIGSVLLGDISRNGQVTKRTRKALLKRLSLLSVATSGPTTDTESAANVSRVVSTIKTTEDAYSIINITNSSTQLTLPSNSRSPSTRNTDEFGSQTGGSSGHLHREYGQVSSNQLSPNNVAPYPKVITVTTESGDHTEREVSYQGASKLISRTASINFNAYDVALQQGDGPEGIGRNARARAPVLSTTVPTLMANSQTQELSRKTPESQTNSPLYGLDATYLRVLTQLLVGLSNSKETEVLGLFKRLIGSLILLANPLSTPALAHLLSISEDVINNHLDHLHSVLSIPSLPGSPLRILHLSFRDFLVDPSKRGKNPFWIDEKEAHQQLAADCLRVMNETLCVDMCQVRWPGTAHISIDPQTISDKLPPAVQYACQYWVYHIQQAKYVIIDNDQVHCFLQQHFLHWLEALSLIGMASESLQNIGILQSLLQSQSSSQVSHFLNDALRFARTNVSTIQAAPLQAYCSALAFAPEKSTIRNTFEGNIPDWISLRPQVYKDWSSCSQTLEGHTGGVSSVAFSPDGKTVASASDDHTVRVWSAATGTCVQTLEGHTGWVYSVAFSPDGKTLASASRDKTVRVWSADAGNCFQSIDLGVVPFTLSFHSDGRSLLTQAGAISLSHPLQPQSFTSSSSDQASPNHNHSQEQRRLGYGISRDRSWVTLNGKDLLWLPADCRPGESAVFGSTVAIGTPSGRIVVMRFSGKGLAGL